MAGALIRRTKDKLERRIPPREVARSEAQVSQVGLHLSPGKDARLHITAAWEQGKAIEIAATWG